MTPQNDEFSQLESFLNRLFPLRKPEPRFRLRLKNALLAEHKRRLSHRQAAATDDSETSGLPWRWPLAASVPLLIGLLAFLWRRSQRPDSGLVPVSSGQ